MDMMKRTPSPLSQTSKRPPASKKLRSMVGSSLITETNRQWQVFFTWVSFPQNNTQREIISGSVITFAICQHRLRIMYAFSLDIRSTPVKSKKRWTLWAGSTSVTKRGQRLRIATREAANSARSQAQDSTEIILEVLERQLKQLYRRWPL